MHEGAGGGVGKPTCQHAWDGNTLPYPCANGGGGAADMYGHGGLHVHVPGTSGSTGTAAPPLPPPPPVFAFARTVAPVSDWDTKGIMTSREGMTHTASHPRVDVDTMSCAADAQHRGGTTATLSGHVHSLPDLRTRTTPRETRCKWTHAAQCQHQACPSGPKLRPRTCTTWSPK